MSKYIFKYNLREDLYYYIVFVQTVLMVHNAHEILKPILDLLLCALLSYAFC